ncbi:hypothetical protein J6590_083059 [Homalodisca vitripennis]|nr:hypothetical protein J6590_083059 [Homalodisca vitripennis]
MCFMAISGLIPSDDVLCYEGPLVKVSVLDDFCGEAGPNCVLGLKKQDAKRVKETERAFEEPKKRQEKYKKEARI